MTLMRPEDLGTAQDHEGKSYTLEFYDGHAAVCGPIPVSQGRPVEVLEAYQEPAQDERDAVSKLAAHLTSIGWTFTFASRISIAIDTQTSGRVWTDSNGVDWVIQEPRDGSKIHWKNPVNLLRADGQWHAPEPLSFRQDSMEERYPALPTKSVQIAVDVPKREYRVTFI